MEHSDGTLPAGNTKPAGRNTKSRTWFITSFQDPLHHFENSVYEAWCSDTSKPEHGSKFHYHHVVHFKNPISFNTIKKAYPTAHFGPPKKDIYACVDYIKKNKNGRKYDVGESGTLPASHRFATIKEVKEMTPEERDNLGINYLRVVEKINHEEQDKNTFFDMLEEIEKDELKAPEIIYITGGTGKGKTYTAYKSALKDYKKEDIGKLTCKNDFIDVINETAKCFVIEEFRSSQIKASDFLQLTDKYGYRANIKGGFVTLRPERLYICSIIRPEELYTNEEINQQFLRRITKTIDLDNNENI